MAEPVFAHAFLAARGRTDLAEAAKLQEQLQLRIGLARQAWPELNVDPMRFVRHLGERARTGEPLEALARLRTDDLYLVCAVLGGDARAHYTLDAHLVDRLVRALSSLAVGRDVVEEAQRRVRELLLLPRHDGPPWLMRYDGLDSLWSWVRVVAVREALAIEKRRALASSPATPVPITPLLGRAVGASRGLPAGSGGSDGLRSGTRPLPSRRR